MDPEENPVGEVRSPQIDLGKEEVVVEMVQVPLRVQRCVTVPGPVKSKLFLSVSYNSSPP